MSACPNIEDLPPAPQGMTGWPWTEGSKWLTPLQPNGRPWPQISIVTPSYNQGRFIEETIRSVLLQGYPNLQYMVVDGGSNDETTSIIKKYEKWISFWCSEDDQGQTNAINKGFARATGEIRGYINSDDYYTKNAFSLVASSYVAEDWDFFIGRTAQWGRLRLGGRNWWRWKLKRIPFPFFAEANCRYEISQESTFWALKHTGAMQFNENLRFCMDVEWFLRIAPGAKVIQHSGDIAYFRIHSESKTSKLQDVCKQENEMLQRINDKSYSARWKRKTIARWRRQNVVSALRSAFGKETYFVYDHPPKSTD